MPVLRRPRRPRPWRPAAPGAAVLCLGLAGMSGCGTPAEPSSSTPGSVSGSVSGSGSVGRATPTGASSGVPSASRTTPARGAPTSSAPTATDTPARDLVAGLRWVSRAGVRALRVTPTAYLREHNDTGTGGLAWAQVVAAVPAANKANLADQFLCHVLFAQHKEGWYLEPARPNVGLARTVAAGCNPGEVADVG